VIESPPSSTADQTDSAVESEFAARRRWGADWVRESGRRLTRWDERGVFGALVIVFCFASIFCPNFLNVANLASILQDITFLGFLAVGMTFALLAGEIDISVGSTFGLVAVVTALLFQHGSATLLAILGGLAVGLAAGFVNGIAAVSLGVPAIIVTLATLGIYRTFVSSSLMRRQSVDFPRAASSSAKLGSARCSGPFPGCRLCFSWRLS